MIQKNIFLQNEGNNWYKRNEQVLKIKDYNKDTVSDWIIKIYPKRDQKVFEVGCSSGGRLKYLKELGFEIGGIEPSEMAVNEANNQDLNILHGTADDLKIKDNSVDILIFGFCLYLVDPIDYFKVANEAYRVLNDNGIIIIHDFAPKLHYRNEYKYVNGLKSFKFDFTQILLSHPHLVLKSKITEIHSDLPSDMNNQDEWVQISLISKHSSLF
jgi:ubiquinone/menaquinone biosynthesis C-methylase UbiE